MTVGDTAPGRRNVQLYHMCHRCCNMTAAAITASRPTLVRPPSLGCALGAQRSKTAVVDPLRKDAQRRFSYGMSALAPELLTGRHRRTRPRKPYTASGTCLPNQPSFSRHWRRCTFDSNCSQPWAPFASRGRGVQYEALDGDADRLTAGSE